MFRFFGFISVSIKGHRRFQVKTKACRQDAPPRLSPGLSFKWGYRDIQTTTVRVGSFRSAFWERNSPGPRQVIKSAARFTRPTSDTLKECSISWPIARESRSQCGRRFNNTGFAKTNGRTTNIGPIALCPEGPPNDGRCDDDASRHHDRSTEIDDHCLGLSLHRFPSLCYLRGGLCQ